MQIKDSKCISYLMVAEKRKFFSCFLLHISSFVTYLASQK